MTSSSPPTLLFECPVQRASDSRLICYIFFEDGTHSVVGGCFAFCEDGTHSVVGGCFAFCVTFALHPL